MNNVDGIEERDEASWRGGLKAEIKVQTKFLLTLVRWKMRLLYRAN